MQQLSLKKMSKKLYILRNVTISANRVSVDGRIVYSEDQEVSFKTFSKNLYRKLKSDYSKFFKMDNLCKLAFLANEFVVRDMNLTQFNPDETAILLSNSGSTFETDSIFTDTLKSIPSPAIFVYTLPNIAIGELSIRMGWKGENLFLVEEKFNPKRIVEQLDMLFINSNTELCLTGWIEFLSSSEYSAGLWLVTDKKDVEFRQLSPMELKNDFSI